MSAHKNKADGGAFMLQYLKQQGPDFANKVDQFENFYLDGANFEADIKMLNGTLKEFKSYGKGSWESFGGTSSLNQLKGYIQSGETFEYIANKTKLMNDGVADPSKFVKEQFQRVFKKDASAIYDTNETFAKKFKLPNGSFVKTKNEFIQLVSIDDFWKQINFIRVE